MKIIDLECVSHVCSQCGQIGAFLRLPEGKIMYFAAHEGEEKETFQARLTNLIRDITTQNGGKFIVLDDAQHPRLH